AIFNLAASFHRAEPGLDHGSPMPVVPAPETLPTHWERISGYLDVVPPSARAPRPIDLRYVDDPPWMQREKGPRPPLSRVWMRADGVLPDDPLLHVCALAFASDMTLLDSVLVGHGLAWGSEGVTGASLDHAMWFHRSFRAEPPVRVRGPRAGHRAVLDRGRPAHRHRGPGGPAPPAPPSKRAGRVASGRPGGPVDPEPVAPGARTGRPAGAACAGSTRRSASPGTGPGSWGPGRPAATAAGRPDQRRDRRQTRAELSHCPATAQPPPRPTSAAP